MRILDGLDLNEAGAGLAQMKAPSSKDHRILLKTAEARRENLDAIAWRCSSAIDVIEGKCRKAEDSSKQELGQLYWPCTTPSCARLFASPEVSFGWARRQQSVIRNEAFGQDVLRKIAFHNAARDTTT